MQESPPISEKNWFYEENGQRQGGLDEQAIIALIHSGKLSYGSAVWRKGLSDCRRQTSSAVTASTRVTVSISLTSTQASSSVSLPRMVAGP